MSFPAETRHAAQKWVEQAIECGCNPMIIQHPKGCINPGGFGLHMSLVDIDRATYPGPLPDNLKDAVFSVLDDMGWVIRAHEIERETRP